MWTQHWHKTDLLKLYSVVNALHVDVHVHHRSYSSSDIESYELKEGLAYNNRNDWAENITLFAIAVISGVWYVFISDWNAELFPDRISIKPIEEQSYCYEICSSPT